MTRKADLIHLMLSVAAIVLAVIALVAANKPEGIDAQTAGETQYVMYLGTNDKDANQPVFSPEEAKAQAESILLKHFGGYTIQEANGGWIDGGTVFQEYTLVICLSDTTPEQVHAAADEMLDVFRQSSVLIQANQTATEFYSGTT